MVHVDDREFHRPSTDEGSINARRRRMTLSSQGESVIPSKNAAQTGSAHSANVHRPSKFGACMQRFFEGISDYITRLFTLPVNRYPPMAFVRPEDYNSAGKKLDNPDEEEYQKKMDLIEAACNYTSKTKDVLQDILYHRKTMATRKSLAHDIDWSKLAPWNDTFLGHLESIFLVLDCSGDGLIDYDEMVVMLSDYGDKTSDADRHSVFSSVDTQGKGAITFAQFVTMFHAVTVKEPEKYPSTLVESFRSLDRNMARIRGLDVVQQLQTGLF